MSEPRVTTTRTIGVVLLSLAAASTTAAALIAAAGGGTFDVAGLEVSMHAVTRPVVAAVALGLLGIGAYGSRSRARADRPYAAVCRDAMLIAAAFAIVIGVSTFARGAHIAGGADSSGYLSEARLWREARFWNLHALRQSTTISRVITPTNGQYVFTPVGFQPAGPHEIVPGYPPGFPIHLALASVLGERAQFAVVPVSAAGLVIVAFVIGRRLGGPVTALVAAFAAGSSPIMLYQAAQPMSDVPAACWWSLAVLLLLEPSKRRLFGAGAAAAIACLVRPNLFAMVPVITLLVWWWRHWRRDALLPLATFLLPVAIAALAFAMLQRKLYGGATTTGYGEIGTLFSLAHVLPNLARYPWWAIFTQSALLILAIAAPVAIRRGWVDPAIDRVAAERAAWSGLLFFASLQVFYLLYLPFDDWVFFRFLLPALPWLLVLQSLAVASLIGALPASTRAVALILIPVLIASWGVGRARSLGAFRLHDSEQRYLDVAGFIRSLPPDAVFLSVQHSGSLAYYGRPQVLRWDWLDAEEIDRVTTAMIRNGHPVFAVLDDWEEAPFRRRFTGAAIVERLGEPIFAAGQRPGITARVFAMR